MKRSTFRVLVTGSRTWNIPAEVMSPLDSILAAAQSKGRTLVVRHGDCPAGADNIAKVWCIRTLAQYAEDAPIKPVREDPWPARWHLGRRAGIERNEEMVEAGADFCLAFIKDASPGASHCADYARKAGIPTVEWTLTGDELTRPDPRWRYLTGLW